MSDHDQRPGRRSQPDHHDAPDPEGERFDPRDVGRPTSGDEEQPSERRERGQADTASDEGQSSERVQRIPSSDETHEAQRFAPRDVERPASGDEGSASDEEQSSERSERDKLVAERDAFKELTQRVQADFVNYRKRAAAQTAADVERATGRLAEALLPVLDAAEAAYLRHPDEVGPLLNSMLSELRKHGLEMVDLENKPFDPELADAVAHEHGEGGDVVVAEVLRSGYRWKGKTLRPAMVRTRD